MDNPKRALSAFNAPSAVEVGGWHVREITLGMAGVLEAIGSPMFTGRKPKTITDWAPTLYAMTRPPGESRQLLASGGRSRLEAIAMQWADDELSVAAARRLINAATAAVSRLNGISPDDGIDAEGGAEGNGLAAGPTAG